jgi:predicted AAA+ superfamily ATPase
MIDADPQPGRFVFTGSAADDVGVDQWPGTGRVIRLPLWGLTRREIEGSTAGPTFVDRIVQQVDGGDEVVFPLPHDRPDTAGYVERALQSGFPEAVRRRSEHTRTAWLESYVDHLVGRDVALIAELPDPARLRRYRRALAATNAATPSVTTLVDATGLNRETVDRYDRLLERLFITEQVPAWASNRLSRVTRRAKRYLCEPAIAATLLGADRRTILRDADLLGRVTDSFVAAQLRAELRLGERSASMFHLRRQDGRREIDILLERTDGAVVAIVIKAATTANQHDARHLAWLRDQLPENQLRAGLVMHTGTFVRPLGERLWAVPICALWG